MTAVQTGLGEPAGPGFVSPELEHVEGGWPGSETESDRRTRSPGRGRRGLVVALAVTALALTSGGLAGGYVADRRIPAPTASAAPGAVVGDLVNAAARTVPGVVSVLVDAGAQTATGSGFALDDQQHVITNDHIVARRASGRRQASVMVETPDGRSVAAEIVGRDPTSDIAVLKVPASTGLTPLPLARPGTSRVGEPVLAVGSPLGLAGTVTAGIISALDREVKLGENRHTAVQTDASINPGNSGGPLVNARGEVVGVNTAIATIDGNGSIGIGFAIPIEQAQQVADTIIGRGG